MASGNKIAASKTTVEKKKLVHNAISVVQQLSAVFLKRRSELAAEVGLTEQQWLILERITDEHFMPSMFAKERDSSPAAVSKILRQLMEKGVIEAGLGAGDGRKREYTLTDKGKKTMDTLRSFRAEAIDSIWMSFDEESLSAFSKFSARLIESIESYSRKEG
jgi:DNA-binding MarR family transcriptional regulator